MSDSANDLDKMSVAADPVQDSEKSSAAANSTHDLDQMSAANNSTYPQKDALSSPLRPASNMGSLQYGDQRLLVFVSFRSGQRLLVSVPATSTIRELQSQALQRAVRLGVEAPLANTVMRTTGPNAAIVDGEDLVSDFLVLTSDNTFSLDLLSTTIMSPAPVDPSTAGSIDKSQHMSMLPPGHSAIVFVRWVTTEGSLTTSKLQQLPVNIHPFNQDTTLHELYSAAVRYLCHGQSTLSTINATDVKLWLKECPLIAQDNPYTLADLGVTGSMQEPLDIFAQLLGPQGERNLDDVSETTSPRDAWGLNTTQRGISTLVTSLMILLDDIANDNIKLETMLELLLEVTHFPPALLAFEDLYTSGINSGNDFCSIHLLADLFSYLCNDMVPEWICSSTESKLEGCRPVFAWLRNLCIEANATDPPKLLHRIQFVDANAAQMPGSQHNDVLGGTEVVELSRVQQTTTSGPFRQHKSISVDLETPFSGLGRLFVLAGNITGPPDDLYELFFRSGENWQDFLARSALGRPGPIDFDNLLEVTNQNSPFKMIDPMQLGACVSADLPIVTLSAKGYVSIFDQQDFDCSERKFYIWNPIEHRVILHKVDPGEFISRELEPIIKERKEAGSWEVDAWAEWTEQANHGDPDESIVVCVDASSSMNKQMPTRWNPGRSDQGEGTTRLDEVKDFFGQLSTRLSSYRLSTNVGLVTFSWRGSIRTVQPLTMLQLDFREKLTSIGAGGGTAIFNALKVAETMLIKQKAISPRTRCRIILLTDGEDNRSSWDAPSVCRSLFDNNIVLDAIVIGTNSTDDLFKIARSTGGYAFHPSTQHVFFQIFLLETFIDIRTRPDIVKAPIENGWDEFEPKPADMQDQFTFPPCRPHPNQSDYFVALREAQRFFKRKQLRSVSDHAASRMDSSAASTVSGLFTPSRSSTGGRLLLSEVKEMVDHAHSNLDVYVSERNVGFWKVIMSGPEGSPYETGTFLLYVDTGLEFPRTPPSVRFITPILHPNISKHGRVCHPIFDREWAPNIHVYEVLQHIFGMLMTLESRDVIDPISTLRFYTDPDEGERQVALYIERFASCSHAALAADILSDDVSSIAHTDTTKDDDVFSISSSRTVLPASGISTGRRRRVASWLPLQTGASAASSGGSGGGGGLAEHLAAPQDPAAAAGQRKRRQQQQGGQRARPPPLMSLGSTSAGPGSASSVASLPLTTSNLAAVPGGQGTGADASDGLRQGRRASFFRELKKAGGTK